MTFLIVLIIMLALIEKIVNKMLGIQREKLSETPGRNIDRWGRSILLISYLITLWFVIANDSDVTMKLYSMTYLTLFLGFQVIMEFIYIKDSKQYISTTILLIFGLIALYNIDSFFY